MTKEKSKEPTPVAHAGKFTTGKDLPVNRLGFGAMRITGNGVWGPPANRDEAMRVLRRAVEFGVNFFDTADSYGPNVSEELIAEALFPYPADLVIAACEGSLRRLRLDRIDL
jgi:pyridoxine 4-dehydrogenase